MQTPRRLKSFLLENGILDYKLIQSEVLKNDIIVSIEIDRPSVIESLYNDDKRNEYKGTQDLIKKLHLKLCMEAMRNNSKKSYYLQD